jgi:hypothetical protein
MNKRGDYSWQQILVTILIALMILVGLLILVYQKFVKVY